MPLGSEVPRSPLRLTRDLQDSEVLLMVTVYYSKSIQNEISKEKKYMGWSWRKTCTSFQVSPPSRFTQDILNSSSNHIWQPVQSVDNQECSPEPRCAGFVLGVSHDIVETHIAPVWLTSAAKVPDLQKKKAGIHHKSHC